MINKKISEKNIPYLYDAYKISIIYAVFGSLWILLSDSILEFVLPSMEEYRSIQTLKGVFYIFITTLLVYELLRRRMKLWHIEYQKSEKAYHELKMTNK